MGVTVLVLLLGVVAMTSLGNPVVTRVSVRVESGEDETAQEPWRINRNTCPPVLCGAPPASDHAPPASNHVPPPNVGFEPSSSESGFPFFEGDIVMNSADRSRMAAKNARRRQGRSKRDVIRPISKLWVYGIVPYVIDDALGTTARENIAAAIETFQRLTCITFRAATDDDTDFLTFIYQPGCWSFIGREGGRQYVSLGPGCDSFGTVLHETSHALGFWHEQSRADRDTYVQVVERNIPPQYLDQFGIRDSDESSTRGYAYDYKSIMHYGKKYFSNNDKPTLRVIGIGRRLGMDIGQRETLSEIDVAQLRAMYYCNQKDARDKVCRDGWNVFDGHCYNFVQNDRLSFVDARHMCEADGGYLLNINSAEEDNYIKNFLVRFYSEVDFWRTGGKKNSSGAFIWVNYEGPQPMTYTNWTRGHPGRFSTMVLSKTRGSNPTYVWKGQWAGAPAGGGDIRYSYSYICEAEPRVPCFESTSGDGRDYRGTLDYTVGGITCQSWASQYPQKHKFMKTNANQNARNGIGEHNYCRNPDGRRARPWCFVPVSPNSSRRRWDYCNVEIC